LLTEFLTFKVQIGANRGLDSEKEEPKPQKREFRKVSGKEKGKYQLELKSPGEGNDPSTNHQIQLDGGFEGGASCDNEKFAEQKGGL